MASEFQHNFSFSTIDFKWLCMSSVNSLRLMFPIAKYSNVMHLEFNEIALFFTIIYLGCRYYFFILIH